MPDFHSLALAWGKGQSLNMIVEQIDLADDLVMQSRRLPSMTIRQEELPLASEAESLVDASWEEAEESVQIGIIGEAVTL